MSMRRQEIAESTIGIALNGQQLTPLMFSLPSSHHRIRKRAPLKRKPDGVLPNGLNVTSSLPCMNFKISISKPRKNHDFVRGHFYGHNDFDPENTLYFFTAGRYEYRNKGVDMFIESLARLNHRLKSSGSKMTVVAFIIMPAQTHSLTVEALKAKLLSSH